MQCKESFKTIYFLQTHEQTCKKWVCKECDTSYTTSLEYHKHLWRTHPTTDVERTWARLEKEGFPNCPSSYSDDPWY